jgi:hypothetical protein
MRNLRVVIAIVACMLIVSWPQQVDSCGPYFSRAVFTLGTRPDNVKSFVDGEIGVIQPSWYRAYLTMAFRQLAGRPLSAGQKRAFIHEWGKTGSEIWQNPALPQWLKERAKYSAKPSLNEEGAYQIYQNCLPAAFEHATEVLRSRVKSFGANSAELKEWLRGQDQVFNHCAGGDPQMPQPLPLNTNSLLRDDRNYQIAAAYFYQGELPEAIKRFEQVGSDKSSVWSALGRYMTARTLLRKAGSADGDVFDSETLRVAEESFRNLAKDPQQKPRLNSIRGLLMFIAHRRRPLEQQRFLASTITSGTHTTLFTQQIRDYTWLLNKYLDGDPDFPGINSWGKEYEKRLAEWRAKRFDELARYRQDELTDWIITMQWETPGAKIHASDQWKKQKSLPWLVAALTKASGTDPLISQLLAGASEVRPTSSGYMTVSYHSVRLLREAGLTGEARKKLEEVVAHRPNMTASMRNLLRTEQMLLATSLAELVPHLGGIPASIDENEDVPTCDKFDCDPTFFAKQTGGKGSLLPQFDDGSARTLNSVVPVALLVKIAESNELPKNLKRRMAPAVWARAALLDDVATAEKAAEGALHELPQLRPYIDGFTAAQDPAERRFATVFALLHFPGLRPLVDGSNPRTTAIAEIDSYRDNWWCKDMGEMTDQVPYERDSEMSERATLPQASLSFLTSEDRQQAMIERAKLIGRSDAGGLLAGVAISWAKSHMRDPRTPEALHLAVRATRYACAGGTSRQSRQAFDLLHKNFPKSKWAKKTPYWF